MDYTVRIKKRNITNDEIENDIKNVAIILKKNTLTTEEYNKHGQFHSSTIIRRYGSWSKILCICNLEILPE